LKIPVGARYQLKWKAKDSHISALDSKTLHVLEYPKILERLAAFCDFSASAELARALRPTAEFDEASERLAETSEARKLLSINNLTIGGAHDIREQVDLAVHGGVLEPKDLLDVHNTLIATRELCRAIEKVAHEYSRLAEIALRLPKSSGLVEAISRAIAENGDILDSASSKLGTIRAEMRSAHDRLMNRLQKYLTDPKTLPMLQDALITQRAGRYVIPLRAEFKGEFKSIIHDQSASGATLFVEPLAVVEANNAYRELQLAERDEERRILAELSTQVGALAGELIPGIAALAQLDLTFAKAKYADEIEAVEPILRTMSEERRPRAADRQQTTDHRPSTVIRLLHARHPLLSPVTVVPIDVDLDPQTFAVIITGPNTGGKTVTLKTVGLLVLMAQAGLHIPALSGSELSCFQAVYADIGDEQSIEQSLSTFSSHITNIIHTLKRANRCSLVLLDELGAGTDPQEGSALARAILSHLLEQGITTFVATHYPELKTYAHVTPGVVNASLEFDIQTLRPTYRLTIGLPGRSNALAIAERLGLPKVIITAARAEVNPEDLRADEMLDDIHRQRRIAQKEREKAERARGEAHRMRRELTEQLEKIEDERVTILGEAQSEAEAQVSALQDEIKVLKQQLQRARQPLEALKPIVEKTKALEETIQKPITTHIPAPVSKPEVAADKPLQVGEVVRLRKLGTEGVVSAIDGDEAVLQAGVLRLRVRLSELRRKAEEEVISDQSSVTSGKPKSKPRPSASSESPVTRHLSLVSSPGMELHLRGQRVEEALDVLDRYLEQAYAAGLPFVRIIHGKGTGTLRQVVRETLKQHPYVASFEEGHEEEGGSGVTVAKLVEN
jgi:DNA mismatch repair protein MutS2